MALPVEMALANSAAANAALEARYEAMWAAMKLRPERLGGTMALAQKIARNKERYLAVERATGVPWPVVGVIHARESGCDFKTHLHNGDPLSGRTIHVPRGRPVAGAPPFTWEASAIDAIRYDGLDKVAKWTIGATARLLEDYNGRGYRNRGLPSPYLWAGTDQYTAGKYVADGKFSATFVDPQPGCMALLQCLATLDPSIRAGDMLAKQIAVADAAPAPSAIKTAIQSPTVHATLWSAVMLKLTAVVSTIGTGIDWALEALPGIKAEIDTQMSVISGLAATAHIDLASAGTWIGIGLLLYAISRHIDLKNWLTRGGIR